jgi:hypothetical protein
MDMHKILQVIDRVESTPVIGKQDMKKFMSVVTESNNRLSMAEQMAMQHYATHVSVATPANSVLKTYFKEAEEEINQRQIDKRQIMNQYSKIIADRVRLKESTGKKRNKPDVIKLDVPLLIRLLEYAREDAETDMDLHNVTEKLIAMSGTGNVLTMEYYSAIVGEQKLLANPDNTQ